MTHADDSVSDNFIRMMQVLADDENLRKWFLSLKPMTDSLRHNVQAAMVEEMQAGGENPDLIEAVESLTDPDVYDAALKTIVHLRD